MTNLPLEGFHWNDGFILVQQQSAPDNSTSTYLPNKMSDLVTQGAIEFIAIYPMFAMQGIIKSAHKETRHTLQNDSA